MARDLKSALKYHDLLHAPAYRQADFILGYNHGYHGFPYMSASPKVADKNTYHSGYFAGADDSYSSQPPHIQNAMNAQIAGHGYALKALGFTDYAMQEHVRNHPAALAHARYEFIEHARNAAKQYKRARIAMGIETE